ncbi:pentapeptide repeat-containing protein [Streptomyces winkii]|uniref:pentapeptide repeat-containing protein n=1 Tax=Streptomyces winkii TaxID=3051178 RepID=UPI0028D0ED32|nr:pentapeptide repeat-containing protein [Streptomyces sp. DSM 40971]
MKTDLYKRRTRASHMRNVRRWGTRTLLLLAALVLFVVLPVGVWKGPYLLDGQYLDTESIGEGAGSAALVTGLRTAMVTCVASIGAGIALFYTARNYRLNHRGQVTDRFTKALERLDSEHIYVRTGGILALEQIVQDAPEQAAHAARVLGHFVRHMRLPSSLDRPDADVQAALSALTRPQSRTHINPAETPDLQDLWLSGAQLSGADLTGARIGGANLTNTQLHGADLTRAWLRGADLTRAGLGNADLTGAWLGGADLTHAQLRGADLTLASLYRANLKGASLEGAKLRGASLEGANLNGARLRGADLTGAHLGGVDFTYARVSGADLHVESSARLRGADLSTAKSLTVEQVLSAASLKGARLPPTIAEDPRIAAQMECESGGGERDADEATPGDDVG